MDEQLKRLLTLLLLIPNLAFAQVTQQEVLNTIASNLPTNNANEISALLLRNTLDVMTSAIFQGAPIQTGTACPPLTGLIPFQFFANITSTTDTTLNLFDGTACIKFANLNQTTHTMGFIGSSLVTAPTGDSFVDITSVGTKTAFDIYSPFSPLLATESDVGRFVLDFEGSNSGTVAQVNAVGAYAYCNFNSEANSYPNKGNCTSLSGFSIAANTGANAWGIATNCQDNFTISQYNIGPNRSCLNEFDIGIWDTTGTARGTGLLLSLQGGGTSSGTLIGLDITQNASFLKWNFGVTCENNSVNNACLFLGAQNSGVSGSQNIAFRYNFTGSLDQAMTMTTPSTGGFVFTSSDAAINVGFDWSTVTFNQCVLKLASGCIINPNGSINAATVFNVFTYGARGDASDDGPAIRAAQAACQASGLGGFGIVYFPQPSVGYLINSLDVSGLGGVMIGDGTNPNSCGWTGEGVNTIGSFNGGVNVKLGNGLNRPLVYVRSGAGTPIITNMRLDGNGVGQTGWTGGPSNRLYTIQVADGVSTPEGSLRLINSWVVNGYNGNLYQGNGRGGLYCQYSFIQFGGQSTNDANVSLNAYDDVFEGCAIGPHTGIGVLITQGTQYFFSNTAIFCNYIGEQINSGLVGYTSHTNMNYQYNSTNGVKTIGGSQTGNVSLVSTHQWINTTFDGNNTNNINNNNTCATFPGGGTASDVLINNDPFAVFISPNFVGNEVDTTKKPNYNIEFQDGGGTASVVQISAPSYNSLSSTTAFTNDFTKLVSTVVGQFSTPTGNNFVWNFGGNATFTTSNNILLNPAVLYFGPNTGSASWAMNSTIMNPLNGNFSLGQSGNRFNNIFGIVGNFSSSMTAASYTVGVTAGASCTLTTVSHLTVVNGIVTVCN